MSDLMMIISLGKKFENTLTTYVEPWNRLAAVSVTGVISISTTMDGFH